METDPNYKVLDEATLDNLMEGCQLIGFDWKYLYVNEAIVQQSKYPTREDLLEHTMMEKYPGIESTELFEVLQQCMSARTEKTMLNEFTFPDGSKGWFELHIEPVPRGLFILSIDITERKRAELAKKGYIKSLEEMLFMVSHRVRHPVCSILGLLNVLDSTKTSKKELIRISGYLREAISSLDMFTKELTSFIHEKKINTEDSNS